MKRRGYILMYTFFFGSHCIKPHFFFFLCVCKGEEGYYFFRCFPPPPLPLLPSLYQSIVNKVTIIITNKSKNPPSTLPALRKQGVAL